MTTSKFQNPCVIVGNVELKTALTRYIEDEGRGENILIRATLELADNHCEGHDSAVMCNGDVAADLKPCRRCDVAWRLILVTVT